MKYSWGFKTDLPKNLLREPAFKPKSSPGTSQLSANHWLTDQHLIWPPESMKRLQEPKVSDTSTANQKPERASMNALQQLACLLARQAAQDWASAHISTSTTEPNHAEDQSRTTPDH